MSNQYHPVKAFPMNPNQLRNQKRIPSPSTKSHHHLLVSSYSSTEGFKDQMRRSKSSNILKKQEMRNISNGGSINQNNSNNGNSLFNQKTTQPKKFLQENILENLQNILNNKISNINMQQRPTSTSHKRTQSSTTGPIGNELLLLKSTNKSSILSNSQAEENNYHQGVAASMLQQFQEKKQQKQNISQEYEEQSQDISNFKSQPYKQHSSSISNALVASIANSGRITSQQKNNSKIYASLKAKIDSSHDKLPKLESLILQQQMNMQKEQSLKEGEGNEKSSKNIFQNSYKNQNSQNFSDNQSNSPLNNNFISSNNSKININLSIKNLNILSPQNMINQNNSNSHIHDNTTHFLSHPIESLIVNKLNSSHSKYSNEENYNTLGMKSPPKNLSKQVSRNQQQQQENIVSPNSLRSQIQAVQQQQNKQKQFSGHQAPLVNSLLGQTPQQQQQQQQQQLQQQYLQQLQQQPRQQQRESVSRESNSRERSNSKNKNEGINTSNINNHKIYTGSPSSVVDLLGKYANPFGKSISNQPQKSQNFSQQQQQQHFQSQQQTKQPSSTQGLHRANKKYGSNSMTHQQIFLLSSSEANPIRSPLQNQQREQHSISNLINLSKTNQIQKEISQQQAHETRQQFNSTNTIKQTNQSQNFRPVVGNFAVKSKPGALPGKPVKTNQDSYIIQTNFCKNKNKYFFSVCDGHGANGHLVSQFVKKILVNNLEAFLKLKNKGVSNDIQSQVAQAMVSGFLRTESNLQESGIDITFSGSTCVGVYMTENRFYCANIGDSRAIVGRFNLSTSSWETQSLSIDHKPDLPFERDRIIKFGGRVDPFKDHDGNPVGPARVWMKYESIPGLAMSRSFGDYVAGQVGVIHEPEVLNFDYTPNDKILVVASDGIWEFLSNEDVINLVTPYLFRNDPEGACEKLIKEATAAWKREDDVIDDITAIVVFLNQ